jgi:anion-transporting  ArsA/GET3 family ATPase
MLSSKIQFHQMRTFSSVERFGKEDENSLNRISELKKSINKLLQLVTQAELSNKQLVITSHINIQIKED